MFLLLTQNQFYRKTPHSRCVHSLLQHSCSTDVSITYLPQVNATHCSKVKINLTLLQYRIVVVSAETAFRALQPQRS